VAFFLLILTGNLNAQKTNLANQTLKATSKATVVIVGKSAKYSYKAAKFTTKHIARPIIVKSAPKIGKFALKTSGSIIKKSYPVGKNLFLKYVKYKFSP
jgi:hypothetical protein